MSSLTHQELIQCVADLSKLMESNPNGPFHYFIHGTICWGKGDYHNCIENLTKVIELAPNAVAAYYGRGKAYKAIGNHGLADVDFVEAKRLKDKGVDWFEAMQFSTNDFRYYLYQGVVCSTKGDHAHAIAHLTKAIELGPNLAVVYYFRGRVYEEMGLTGHADTDFAEARWLRNEPE